MEKLLFDGSEITIEDASCWPAEEVHRRVAARMVPHDGPVMGEAAVPDLPVEAGIMLLGTYGA